MSVEEAPGTGWAANVLDEVVSTVSSRNFGPRGPLEEPSSSAAEPAVAVVTVNEVPTKTRDEHLEGMRKMVRVMGNVPDSILNSNNKEVILAFFQGRMSQSHSGGGSGGSPEALLPA